MATSKIILDSRDIAILISLWEEGARIIELGSNENDNRRRIYRLSRAGLCGCSRQEGMYIWGINPSGIEAIKLSEMEYAGQWRKPDFKIVYQSKE